MLGTEKRQVKACAFDLGNTLINDTQLFSESISDMGDWLLENSVIESKQSFIDTYTKINHETKRPFISHTFGEIEFFKESFKKLAINAILPEEALKRYREILVEKIHPDKNIVASLQLLKKRDIRIALLSNETVRRVDAYMKRTKLRHFFDTIIISEGIGIEKPDLRFFQEALNRLNIKGEEMIMFGDNEIADGASKKLGIFFVLVTDYMNRSWIWEKGNPYSPDYIMEKITPKEMEKFLRMIA